MIKPLFVTLLSLFIGVTLFANSNSDSAFVETDVVLHTATGDVFGTLTLPKKADKIPVALIIAGSGPTDRNGNQLGGIRTACLKKLAYGLASNNIASLRFDKRGIGESIKAMKSEADLRFDDYIHDAEDWITLLKKDSRFSKVFVVGHSEGSLIGMLAAQHLADGYVSVAGAGMPAAQKIKEQISAQYPPDVKDAAFLMLDSLSNGSMVHNKAPELYTLFRRSVQSYMISWFRYDPQAEIKKLTIPILIIQGTNDLQVSEEDARLLAKASPKAKLVMIKNMNHIFRIVEGGKDANVATYTNPALPISDELTRSISEFINKN